jgi:hypothetical protein
MAITATSPTTISAVVGRPVNITFVPTGGAYPFTTTPTNLPTGLSTDGLTLTGTPVAPGHGTFYLNLRDSAGLTYLGAVTFNISVEDFKNTTYDHFPPGYNAVHNALLDWGQSGLIPHTKIIKSYHPPIKDPVTGILVELPATTYDTGHTTNVGYLMKMTGRSDLSPEQLINAKAHAKTLATAISVLKSSSPRADAGALASLALDIAADTNQGQPVVPNTTGSTVGDLAKLLGETATNGAVATVTDYHGTGMPVSFFTAVPGVTTDSVGALLNTISRYALGTVPAVDFTPAPATIGMPVGGVFSIPNAPLAGSKVSDYNVNTVPGGPDTALSTYMSQNANLYRVSAYTAKDQLHYQQLKSAADITTPADIIASTLGRTLPRITDSFDDAAQFYNTPFNTQTTDNTDPNASTTVDPAKRDIPAMYDLVATGVPCALPGVLNCYMAKYDNVSTQPYAPTYPRLPNNTIISIKDSDKQLLKHPVESVSAPAAATLGDRYYNTTDGFLYVYNGSSWVKLSQKRNIPYNVIG